VWTADSRRHVDSTADLTLSTVRPLTVR
jgi:hypothetical protein